MKEDKNICVYLHINKQTKETFYVGIGNIKRPYIKTYRNNLWNEYVQDNEYEIDIIHTGLTWGEAAKIEKRLIVEIGRKDKGLGN